MTHTISNLRVILILVFLSVLADSCTNLKSDKASPVQDTEEAGMMLQENTSILTPPRPVKKLDSLIQYELEHFCDIDADSVFADNPAEAVNYLDIAANDTVVVIAAVDNKGIDYIEISGLASNRRVMIRRRLSFDFMSVYHEKIPEYFNLTKEQDRLRSWEGETKIIDAIAKSLITFVIQDNHVVEVSSIRCSMPQSTPAELAWFDSRTAPKKIRIKELEGQKEYDKSFKTTEDYKFTTRHWSKRYSPSVSYLDIDSILDIELDNRPYLKAANFSRSNRGISLKGKLNPTDTFAVYVKYDVIRYSKGSFIPREDKLAEGSNPFIERDVEEINRIVNNLEHEYYESVETSGDLECSSYNVTIESVSDVGEIVDHQIELEFQFLAIFYIKDGKIAKSSFIDRLTTGARKYYKSIADK